MYVLQMNKFRNPVSSTIPKNAKKDTTGRSWCVAPTEGEFQWEMDNLYHVWFHSPCEIPEEDEIITFPNSRYIVDYVYMVGRAKRCPVQMRQIA